jgi:signal transduction histidine kinase
MPNSAARQPAFIWPETQHLITPDERLAEVALKALRKGDVERATALLDQGTGQGGLTMAELLRLHLAETEAQAQQQHALQAHTEAVLAWFTKLFEALPVPALLLGSQGQLRDANKAACRYLGLPHPLPLQPTALRRFLTGAEADRTWLNLLQEVRQNGETERDELLLQPLTGEARVAQLKLCNAPVLDVDRDDEVLVCTLNDLTDRAARQSAEQRATVAQQQRQLASDASDAKTQMLSRVSHELRTPLNAIMGFSQLLQSDLDTLPEAHRPYLAHILRASQDLLSLVDEVLEINRAEAGHLRLDMTALSLRDEARLSLQLNQQATGQLQVELLMVEPDGAPPMARGDARRVREILCNLISNAIKYNRFRGKVQLSIGHDGQRIWVDVSDQGMGLDAKQQAHLFEPFNRLGAERGSARGFGLGLSICKAYTDAMDGELTLVQSSEQGSCFRLSLPRWDRLA